MSKEREAAWPLGSNNIADPDRLPDGFAREAVNFDYTNTGKLRLRPGYLKLSGLNDARGAVGCGESLIIADGAELKLFDTRNSTMQVLGACAPGGFFAGAELNGQAYLCTPVARHRVDGEELLPWGIDAPLSTIQIVQGRLPAGVYRVAVTAMSADGIESGTTPMIVDLQAGRGLVVDYQIPDGAVSARMYVSVENGEALYLQGERAAGAFALDMVRNDTALLSTAYMAPPPIGDTVVAFGSRLLIAFGNVLAFTEPFMPHLFQPSRNFISYAADISVVVAVGSFVYVVADRTYCISGLGTASQQSQPIPPNVGAVRGSGALLPDGRGAWMTKYGQAFAGPDGAVVLPNRNSYAPPLADAGTAGVMEHRGNQVLVTTMRGKASANSLSMTDFIDAEFTP